MATPDPMLRQFVNKLVEEKQFESTLDADVLSQIRQDLLSRLEDRINAKIILLLPPEKLEEFTKMLDGANDEEINTFCQSNIRSLDEIIAEELVRFRNIYLNS